MMRLWSFKIENNTRDIINKLNLSLGSTDAFVFNIDNESNNIVEFNLRKRVLNPFQILLNNKVIINGKILKSKSNNETDIEISFAQHYLTKFIIFSHIIVGLILIVLSLQKGFDAFSLVIGGIFLIIGVSFWIDVKNRFEKNILNYKKLISDILDLKKT